ncbi:thymidylate kinase [compost metagenome]
MILMISGCDGTGKSTLVKALSEKLGWENKHFDKPKNLEDGKEQYFNFAKTMNDQPHKNIICDRLHDGEWVYAPLYRGYKGNYMREFEREITKNHNFLFVYVKASLDTIIDRTRKRGEDFVKEEHFQTVLDSFEEYLNEQALPFIVIDTTNSNTDEDVERIINAMNKVDKIWNCVREGDCPDAILKNVQPRGNVESEIMIVAQNPGGRGNGEYSTIWADGPNSDFVLSAIQEAGIFNNSWFTNLVPYPTEDNKITKEQIEATEHILYAQIELLRPKILIGLGSFSSDYLNKNFGKVIKVIKQQHPAYVKRFLSGNKNNHKKYVEIFSEAKTIIEENEDGKSK